ncbi:MAG: nucleoside deaminase [Muribaculaceae bacterium]
MLYENSEERDERFMRMALAEAMAAAEEDEVPVGAVVVCGGRVIARTHNLTERLRDVTAHAEMQAITAAAEHLNGKYLTDCTLYVTLEPCPMCAAALCWAQTGRVVYGASDPRRGYRAAFADPDRALHPRTEVTSGVLADEALALLRGFFRRRR